MTLKNDVFKFIAEQGEVRDEQGYATRMIHNAFKYTTINSISHTLRMLDADGNIDRVVNGKKTYAIWPTEIGWKNAKALFGINKSVADPRQDLEQEEAPVETQQENLFPEVLDSIAAEPKEVGELWKQAEEHKEHIDTIVDEAHSRVEEVVEPQPPAVDEVGAAVIAELRRMWQQEEDVKKTLSDAKRELDDLRISHKRAYEELKTYDSKTDGYRGEIADLKSKLATSEATIEELRKDNAKKIGVIDSLTGQVNALNKRLEEAKHQRPLGGSLSMEEWSRIGKGR